MVTTLTNEQLVARIQNGGDEVCHDLETLWKQNNGLIQIYVKKYSCAAEHDDLIQESYIALCSAVNNYRQESGLFSTYLGFWLHSCLGRYCRQNTGPFRVPEYKHTFLYQYRKISSDFVQNFHRDPSLHELQDLMGVTRDEVNQVIFLDIARSAASLHKPMGFDEDESITLADCIPSEEDLEGDVLERVYQSEMKTAVNEELQKLPDDQAAAIRLVYLEGLTMEKAAAKMEVLPSQIRSMIERGFRILRGKPARRLRPFIRDEALAAAYKGSFHRFRDTGFSSTEKAAFRDMGISTRR